MGRALFYIKYRAILARMGQQHPMYSSRLPTDGPWRPGQVDNRLLYSASCSARAVPTCKRMLCLPERLPWAMASGSPVFYTRIRSVYIVLRSCLRAKQRQRGKPTHAPKQGRASGSVPRLGRQLRFLACCNPRARSTNIMHLLSTC